MKNNAAPLYDGGIMVNYRCNASCRHCLYSCSPSRKQGYVDEDAAEKICRFLVKGCCRCVHIGGGEPFLNFESLIMMIRKLEKSGITLSYIETNAFWAVNASAKDQLITLLREGVDTLCISVDPFHAEYVPYGCALALAALCEDTGMNYFLWQERYFHPLSKLDSAKTHSRPEMEKALSLDYIHKTAQSYGINYGGRAVNIEKEFLPLRPAKEFAHDDTPCKNLTSSSHFHVDMEAYFIPPRCTGIRIPLQEAVEGIPENKYKAFDALYNGGVSDLYKLAVEHGFSPDEKGYPSKCNLCFHLRYFLSDKGFPELDENHYEEALKN